MPIEQDAFYSMLGIARRAGALTLGADAARAAVASGQAGLVLVDGSASDNTQKRLADACAYYGVRLAKTQPERLGQAVGRPGRMCAAVARGTLCDRLIALAGQD
ncbi:MAG: L7Ae/L30e/S12e/Gadd45 family ribosomal protein [Candidatus Ventricola sp.]